MTPFKTNRQGKPYFQKPYTPKRSTHANSFEQKIPPIKTMFENAFAWYGCYALPDQCLVIKGFNIAYKIFKQKPLNRQYEDKIENIFKLGVSKFTSTVAEDEISKVSKEIIIQVNDSGLINYISKNTEMNENIIEKFMEGTISNLLKDKIENGTGFLIKKVT